MSSPTVSSSPDSPAPVGASVAFPRLLLGQLSPVLGDLEGNLAQARHALQQARLRRRPWVLLPELSVTGYPPKDLLLVPAFVEAAEAAAVALAAEVEAGEVLIFGAPWRAAGGLWNAAIVATGGTIVAVVPKVRLPTYDVFDEARWFMPGAAAQVVELQGLRVGITICEDIWFEPGQGVGPDPIAELRGRCDLVLNLSASPFHAGKGAERLALLGRQARRLGAPIVYCNQVGGHDELLFDGDSLAVNAAGALVARGPSCGEAHIAVDLADAPVEDEESEVEEQWYRALLMGIRDYARRTGFDRALIGLSGGIDSALVATLAADALGADKVLGIGMPGPYSSEGSVTDARDLAARLGIRFELLPIGAVQDALTETLKPLFGPRRPDLTEENTQARARGTLLMAVSNKLGHLLLTTGNKSETAVGYCTLYGDMNGGLAVISDLYKTEIWRLSRWINRIEERIPWASIEKAPSAELRPDQTDQDSLPPYEVLDPILHAHVERGLSAVEIAKAGIGPADLALRVVRMVARAEYKRWQAAPGLRLSPKAFGTGRRMPLTARWPAS